MTDTAILEVRLAEAEAALHQLQIGKSTVSVSYDGKSVSYSAARIADLQSYILTLRSQLGRGPRRVYGLLPLG